MSIPSSPRSSSSCSAASGTCTPTVSCPPTSGRSTTSTRRCTPGRRCASSRSTGRPDYQFLARVFHKLLINFTWWVNREDAEGNNIFEGGFLGLDNIGPFDRSVLLPDGGHLEQSDGTAWMAMYSLNLLEMALILATYDRTYEDVATKFFEHFAAIATAMNEQGLWDEHAGFYYDSWQLADGTRIPIQARSIVGLIPLCAATTLGDDDAAPPARLRRAAATVHQAQTALRRRGVARARGRRSARAGCSRSSIPSGCAASSTTCSTKPSFSATTACARSRSITPTHPLDIDIGGVVARLDYEPAESTSRLYGGNSNWRGPVWFPGQPPDHRGAARLPPLPRRRVDGRVPARVRTPGASRRGRRRHRCAAGIDLSPRTTTALARSLQAPSCTHARTSPTRSRSTSTSTPRPDAGLGASHQTGWTGLVADLLLRGTRARDRFDVGTLHAPEVAAADPSGQKSGTL